MPVYGLIGDLVIVEMVEGSTSASSPPVHGSNAGRDGGGPISMGGRKDAAGDRPRRVVSGEGKSASSGRMASGCVSQRVLRLR